MCCVRLTNLSHAPSQRKQYLRHTACESPSDIAAKSTYVARGPYLLVLVSQPITVESIVGGTARNASINTARCSGGAKCDLADQVL